MPSESRKKHLFYALAGLVGMPLGLVSLFAIFFAGYALFFPYSIFYLEKTTNPAKVAIPKTEIEIRHKVSEAKEVILTFTLAVEKSNRQLRNEIALRHKEITSAMKSEMRHYQADNPGTLLHKLKVATNNLLKKGQVREVLLASEVTEKQPSR